jgi:hypothetical protein
LVIFFYKNQTEQKMIIPNTNINANHREKKMWKDHMGKKKVQWKEKI